MQGQVLPCVLLVAFLAVLFRKPLAGLIGRARHLSITPDSGLVIDAEPPPEPDTPPLDPLELEGRYEIELLMFVQVNVRTLSEDDSESV